MTAAAKPGRAGRRLADVNHDGHADVVAADSGGNDVSVIPNGSGDYYFHATNAPADALLSNVNGDDEPDVFLPHRVPHRRGTCT